MESIKMYIIVPVNGINQKVNICASYGINQNVYNSACYWNQSKSKYLCLLMESIKK